MQDNWNGTLPVGTFILIAPAGNGWLMVDDENGALSAAIIPQPGPYAIPGSIKQPTTSPVPSPVQEKNATPSIDPYITERDRWTVASLPPEGRKQFGDNVHRYIRQLGKDYLDEADDAAS